jgi:hypothetical protein
MNQNPSHVDQYEAPEVFELGSAEVLTLGTGGCCSDCCGCPRCGGAEEFA